MTVENFFNLNLVAENQYIALKVLGSNVNEVEFRFNRKDDVVNNYCYNYKDWNISHFTTEVIKQTNFEPKSYLIINLFRKTKGE